MSTSTAAGASARRFAAPALLVVGAGFYAVSQTVFDVTYFVTPLVLGLVVLAAAVVGRVRRMLANGLVLAGWGVGVLAAAKVLPAGREAPAYLLGMAAGIAAARALSRPDERSVWFSSAVTTAVASSLAFFLAYDVAALDGWPAWTVGLVAWAALEAVRTLRASATPPPGSEARI